MARKKNDTITDDTRRKSSPRVSAPCCERINTHKNTRIVMTRGRIRRCICDDCGHSWTITGPFADDLREYASNLSDSLAASPRQDVGGVNAVVIPDALAKEMAAELQKLATT